jgi:hypothetical protein
MSILDEDWRMPSCPLLHQRKPLAGDQYLDRQGNQQSAHAVNFRATMNNRNKGDNDGQSKSTHIQRAHSWRKNSLRALPGTSRERKWVAQ